MNQLLTLVITGEYWSQQTIAANLTVALSILGSLMLGMIVGFERSYQGRAAGVRTYGMVCMASCSIVVISGHSHLWFGGALGGVPVTDCTRTIQGILTGIGFLGAGIIHRDRYQTSGLTTAASLWASSAIGIMVGVGFYAAAILLSALCIACMAFVASLERLLPAKNDLFVKILFDSAVSPTIESLNKLAAPKGYSVSQGSITITCNKGQPEWSFVITSNDRNASPIADLANELARRNGIVNFEIAHLRS
jgi:putative Mg2+ transporter-C (MgtC) family protein